jgi:hypothetical protein
MTLESATTPDRQQPPPCLEHVPDHTTVDALIARFNTWLTRQDVSPQRRHCYSTHAEQYLRWQAGGPDPHADRTQYRYFTRLRRKGVSEVEIGMVRTSLSLLGRHLITAKRAGWIRPGRISPARTSSPVSVATHK